jgi:CRISPR-associated protein Cas2
MAALTLAIEPDYDSIVTYTARSPEMVETSTLGVALGGPGDIL